MMSKIECPVCHNREAFIIDVTRRDEKLTSCGHSFKFSRTKSEKLMDRKYRRTEWGLEKIEPNENEY